MKPLFYISIIFILASCKKTVVVAPPQDQILSDQVFTSDSKADAAVTAIYGNMINGSSSFASSLLTICGGLSSDELSRFNPSLVFQELQNNDLTPTNGQVKNIWTSAYKSIYFANAILEGLNKSNQISANAKTQLTGECKFIRALSYFYLVNLFGSVPLATTTDYTVNAALSRTPPSEVYKLIVADLIEAKGNLPVSYTGSDKTRPSRWAATALLARVYLYLEDWPNANVMASEVLDNGIFTPLIPVQNIFLKNSKEAIWQLAPTNGAMQETRLMRPSGNTPQMFLTTSILASFEPQDVRRSKWIDSITYQSSKYYYPAKYRNTSAAATEYYSVLRIGEQYLIRAEARAHLGDLTGAISDLNTVRSRAGLNILALNLSESQVFSSIEKERRIELFAEWGHRWLDLKRTGKANILLGSIKNTWQSTDILYPIPQEELLLNQNLTQNPGY